MEREMITGKNGYDIPAITNLKGEMVVIICHGLGSTKESPTAIAIAEALDENGIGSVRFDFPGHGDSPADGTCFTMSNCVADLQAAEEYVREKMPEAEIAYFASSFGAYTALSYFAKYSHPNSRAFLRCAAVDIPSLFWNNISGEEIAKNGYVVLDYDKPLKITEKFYKELSDGDLFKLCNNGMAKIAMIHGDADETAPVEDALRFAETFGAQITICKGAGHRFQGEGETELVIKTALEFFNAKELV